MSTTTSSSEGRAGEELTPGSSAASLARACGNCISHACGLYYAECACCAAHAADPGDVTFGAAALTLLATTDHR